MRRLLRELRLWRAMRKIERASRLLESAIEASGDDRLNLHLVTVTCEVNGLIAESKMDELASMN